MAQRHVVENNTSSKDGGGEEENNIGNGDARCELGEVNEDKDKDRDRDRMSGGSVKRTPTPAPSSPKNFNAVPNIYPSTNYYDNLQKRLMRFAKLFIIIIFFFQVITFSCK